MDSLRVVKVLHALSGLERLFVIGGIRRWLS